MNKNPVAFLDFIRLFYERQGREALEEGSSCDSGLEGRGDGIRFRCGGATVFSVCGEAEPGYAIAAFEVVELAWAGRYDCPFCFAAKDVGLGGRVEPGSKIAVESTVSDCFEIEIRIGVVGRDRNWNQGGEKREFTCRCS